MGCNGFDVEGEPGPHGPFSFEDAGANACGCPDQAEECIAQTAGLEPPEAVVTP